VDTTHNNREFDAIIVGSGPSGAAIARDLSKRKKKVLILERGGDGPLKEEFLATRNIFSTVTVGDNLATGRAFTTGGTTSVYFAVAGLPPLDTFASLGVDLSRQLEETKSELPLDVLPDRLLGAPATRVRESAIELGYAWTKNIMSVDLTRCASGYSYEAKWNARTYLQQAVDEGATLITRARVEKVLIEKGRAIGVEYRLDKGKNGAEACRALATRTILAAGASASPLILRDSGMKSVLNSGFFLSPSFALFGVISGQKAEDSFVGSMGAELGDEISLGDANVARTVYRMSMLGSLRFVRALFHSKSIGVGVKVRDGLGGGLQEDGRYHKQLKKEEIKKMNKGEEAARRIIQKAGGKRIFKSPTRGGQLGGIIRIGQHVDEKLQTEYSHLHVCDGSVIPESVNVPPTLTLICLGKYLANHLSHAL
jgi:hypothetical protein